MPFFVLQHELTHGQTDLDPSYSLVQVQTTKVRELKINRNFPSASDLRAQQDNLSKVFFEK
jgi:hypothetical protein